MVQNRFYCSSKSPTGRIENFPLVTSPQGRRIKITVRACLPRQVKAGREIFFYTRQSVYILLSA